MLISQKFWQLGGGVRRFTSDSATLYWTEMIPDLSCLAVLSHISMHKNTCVMHDSHQLHYSIWIVQYRQGYHTILISKICPVFAVLHHRKCYCPSFLEMSLFMTCVLIFCSITILNKQYLIDIQIISISS